MLPWKIPKPPRTSTWPQSEPRRCLVMGNPLSHQCSAFPVEGRESGRRRPNGAARALLMVIQHNPEAYRAAAQAAIATSAAQ
jgi:hypothetical protein